MRQTLFCIAGGILCLCLLCWYISDNSYSKGKQDCTLENLQEMTKASEEILRLQADNKNLQLKLAESIKNEEKFKEILRTKLPDSVAQLLNSI